MAFKEWTTDRTPHQVGDRVITDSRLELLSEQFEGDLLDALHDLLAEKTGTVTGVQVYDIAGAAVPVKLSVATVELDHLRGAPITFHVDELHPTFRYVHVIRSTGAQIVRYEPLEQWFYEHDGVRELLTFRGAVHQARKPDSAVTFGLPGAEQFDAAVREARDA